jgi:peptide/nickel transport system substrate-binding protein
VFLEPKGAEVFTRPTRKAGALFAASHPTSVAPGRRYLALAVTCSIAAVAVIAGGVAQSATSARDATPSKLTVRLQGDFTNFDPAPPVGTPNPTTAIITALYDRLLAPGKNGALLPYLASSWTVAKSAKQITFHLRTGVTCTDGSPLTATDVAASLTRFFTSLTSRFALAGGPYTAVGNNAKHTVIFTSAVPNPDNVYGLASPFSGIVCAAGLANPAALLTTPSGSGAYTLTSAVHGSAVTLTRNPRWKWGPNGLKASLMPQTLVQSVVLNDTTAANELLTGQLDGSLIVGADVGRLYHDKSIAHVQVAWPKILPLVMNQLPGHATNDPQVRRAIMTAIDPKAWGQAAFPGNPVTRGPSLFAPTSPCYDPATKKLKPTYSLTAAKQILLNDGYTQGSDGKLRKDGQPLAVTVLGATSLWGQGQEYTAAQLTSLGMNVTTRNVDFGVFGPTYVAGKWDVAVAQVSAPNPAPFTFMTIVSQGTPESNPPGTNYARIIDPTLDALVLKAVAAGSKNCKAWNAVQQRALKNYDWLPLASPVSYFFGRKSGNARVTVDLRSSSYIEGETIRWVTGK